MLAISIFACADVNGPHCFTVANGENFKGMGNPIKYDVTEVTSYV